MRTSWRDKPAAATAKEKVAKAAALADETDFPDRKTTVYQHLVSSHK